MSIIEAFTPVIPEPLPKPRVRILWRPKEQTPHYFNILENEAIFYQLNRPFETLWFTYNDNIVGLKSDGSYIN